MCNATSHHITVCSNLFIATRAHDQTTSSWHYGNMAEGPCGQYLNTKQECQLPHSIVRCTPVRTRFRGESKANPLGCQPYAPAAFTPQEIFLVLIYIRG
jgi:hypothetical protein